jgi:hypothetical protein
MPAMPDLANEFSWSRSRDNTFQECRRRYFYHYYGSWGGWDAGAPEDIRRLYILKQLASRQMWAGRVVHDVIERMRGEWRSSKAARYRDSPKTLALYEHEYAVDLKPEVWQALSRNVGVCLRNFFRLPLVASIRKTSPEHWSIEHWSKVFQFEGTPVWMAPDFGFWTDDGRLALVDWKTGGSTPDGAAFQLGCYALYAAEVLGVPPAKVDLFEANLREPEVTQLTWSDERLDAIKEQLRLSVRSMRAYLVDPAANVAAIADFEKAEDLRICRWCNFRVVCRPELT